TPEITTCWPGLKLLAAVMVATPFDQVAAVMLAAVPPVGSATDPADSPVGVYWLMEVAVALLVSVPEPVPTWLTTTLPDTKPGTNARPAKFMLPLGLAGAPWPGVPPTNARVEKLPGLKP